MRQVRAVWCTLQSSNQRAKLINVHNPTHPYSYTLTHSIAFTYQYACIAEKKEAKTKKNMVTPGRHTPLTKLLNSQISFPLPTHTHTHTRKQTHPYAYSLTHSLTHSRSQISPLAFFHLHYFSPPGRPAQRSAAAGIHPYHCHLQSWRLCCHPTHTHRHTHSEWERGWKVGREERKKKGGEEGTRKESAETDRKK